MTAVCGACHSSNVIDGHFAKLDSTLKEVDALTRTATAILLDVWDKGLENRANPFDESIERIWVRIWLFYANSVKYASAMTGAPDYAAFKNGWWEITEALQQMKDLAAIKALLPRGK